MKKVFTLLLAISLFIPATQAQFDKLIKKAKDEVLGSGVAGDETGKALKEALNKGVDVAVQSLSAEDGYISSPYKILVPSEAQQVIKKVKMVPGFENVEKTLIDKMNKAAEYAAKEASPIFIDAIKGITIQDGMNILMGADNAATQFLEKGTRSNLYSTFMPVIQKSLDEVNARTYWSSVVKAYNQIPFVKRLNPALDDHVNQKALDGLFSLIATKEKGIRNDAGQRSTDLLKKVFAKQD